MGVEGQGVRGVVMRRQGQYVIQRFDQDTTGKNVGGVIIPEKEELQHILLYHQPISEKLLNEPGGQRTKNDKMGWTLSEEKIENGDVVTIKEKFFTVNDLQEFDSHSEFTLIRSGPTNNKAE